MSLFRRKDKITRQEEKRVFDILYGKKITSRITGLTYNIVDVQYRKGELWVKIYNYVPQCYEWFPYNRFRLGTPDDYDNINLEVHIECK